MKILCLGDVVGKPGVQALRAFLPKWREELDADCVIVAVAHREFRDLGLDGIRRMDRAGIQPVLIDVKGIYPKEELERSDLLWWRL